MYVFSPFSVNISCSTVIFAYIPMISDIHQIRTFYHWHSFFAFVVIIFALFPYSAFLHQLYTIFVGVLRLYALFSLFFFHICTVCLFCRIYICNLLAFAHIDLYTLIYRFTRCTNRFTFIHCFRVFMLRLSFIFQIVKFLRLLPN